MWAPRLRSSMGFSHVQKRILNDEGRLISLERILISEVWQSGIECIFLFHYVVDVVLKVQVHFALHNLSRFQAWLKVPVECAWKCKSCFLNAFGGDWVV